MKKAAVLTISDSRHERLRTDSSGPALSSLLTEAGWTVVRSHLVPDDVDAIRNAIRELATSVALIVTTGGTGLAPRDVTPEAVRPLLDKEIPGLGELMRASAFQKNKASALSRSLAGTMGGCLILCLPGSPAGASESLAAVLPVLTHALYVLLGQAEHKES